MLRSLLIPFVFATAAVSAVAEPLNYNVINFSESAGMEVQRDTMTARFEISTQGKDRTAVNREFTQKFNGFHRRADRKPFKTELLNRTVVPRYQYNNGKQTQIGWEERAEFKVESQDFAALNRLIAETQNEARVSYTAFSVSKQKREAVIDEVSQAALLRFKERAKILTHALGHRDYKIVKLNLGHIGNHTVNGNDMAQMKMYRTAPEVASMNGDALDTASPGTEDITVTVDGSIQGF